MKIHIIVDIRGICRSTYLSAQNGIIFYANWNTARKMVFDMPANVAQRMECMLAQRRINLYVQHVLRCANMLALRWHNEQTYIGPT